MYPHFLRDFMNYQGARWSADSLFPLVHDCAETPLIFFWLRARFSGTRGPSQTWACKTWRFVRRSLTRRSMVGWPGDRTVPERQIAFLFATKAEENRAAAAASGRPKVRAVYLVRQSKQVLSALSPSLSSLTSKVVDRPTDRLEERPMELCAPGRPTPRESAAQHVE